MKEMNDLHSLDLNTLTWTEICEDSNRLLTMALTMQRNTSEDRVGSATLKTANQFQSLSSQQPQNGRRSFMGMPKHSLNSIHQPSEKQKDAMTGGRTPIKNRNQRSFTESSRNNSSKTIKNNSHINQLYHHQAEPTAFSPEGNRARSPPGNKQ